MDKIAQINKVIEEYFEKNISVHAIPAKDLMPYFIRAGIFTKDEKNGLPIRKILRQLDEPKQRSKIPYVIAERKAKNTNWFFGRTGNKTIPKIDKAMVSKSVSKKVNAAKGRKDSDEHYIIDLCDELLGLKGSRQHRFDFVRGDAGTKLPVDVYYESLKLVVEFNEQQHSKAVNHFDKPDKLTISGVHRGEQRKIYDKRKRSLLPQQGITVLDISYSVFECDSKGKIKRNRIKDLTIVKKLLNACIK